MDRGYQTRWIEGVRRLGPCIVCHIARAGDIDSVLPYPNETLTGFPQLTGLLTALEQPRWEGAMFCLPLRDS